MTPLREGRVVPLDPSTEAIYLFGTESGRSAGWYIRLRTMGGTGHIVGGPFESLEKAQAVYTVAASVDVLKPSMLDEADTYVRTVRASVGLTGQYRAASGGDENQAFHILVDRARGEQIPGPDKFTVVRPGRLYLGSPIRIDDYVKLEAGLGTVIGHRVHVASFCHLGIGGGYTILEEGASTGSGTKLISGSSMPSPVGCSPLVDGCVIERSFVWMQRCSTCYAGAIMLPGSVLGERSILAAGAVLARNTIVPAGQLWAGVPARLKRKL